MHTHHGSCGIAALRSRSSLLRQQHRHGATDHRLLFLSALLLASLTSVLAVVSLRSISRGCYGRRFLLLGLLLACSRLGHLLHGFVIIALVLLLSSIRLLQQLVPSVLCELNARFLAVERALESLTQRLLVAHLRRAVHEAHLVLRELLLLQRLVQVRASRFLDLPGRDGLQLLALRLAHVLRLLHQLLRQLFGLLLLLLTARQYQRTSSLVSAHLLHQLGRQQPRRLTYSLLLLLGLYIWLFIGLLGLLLSRFFSFLLGRSLIRPSFLLGLGVAALLALLARHSRAQVCASTATDRLVRTNSFAASSRPK